MTPFLQLALSLAIIIFTAKLGGYLSLRLGQPSVLGELLVGIFLGPSVLDIFHYPYFSDDHLLEILHELAEIGVLLLMFLAGLDLHLTDLLSSSKASALAGTMGVIFPLLLGAGCGVLFGMEPTAAVFLGLILSATSVSISAQTLMELGVLRSRVGVSLLGAAVFDDVLVVLGLSVFTAVFISGAEGGLLDVLLIVLRMAAFLGIAAGVGFWLLPWLTRKINNLPISQGVISFTVVMILIYAWSAETFGGMAGITGAFLAGLVLGRSAVKERIENGISSLAYGVFVPIFFISVGLSADTHLLTMDSLWLMVGLATVAIVGKIFGSGLGAYLAGFNRLDALRIGTGMVSRGEVGLIVASVGISEGIIAQSAFAAIVGVVIITTLLTPAMLRALYPKPAKIQTLQ